MPEWVMKKLKDIADFNPRESLPKGTVAKKIAMDKLQPFYRDVPGYELEPFSGRHFLLDGSFGAFCLSDRFRTPKRFRSEEHTSELQSRSNLVCRLLLEKKK